MCVCVCVVCECVCVCEGVEERKKGWINDRTACTRKCLVCLCLI